MKNKSKILQVKLFSEKNSFANNVKKTNNLVELDEIWWDQMVGISGWMKKEWTKSVHPGWINELKTKKKNWTHSGSSTVKVKSQNVY